MSRTIQSEQQKRGRQIAQDKHKTAQAGKGLPGGKKPMKRSNPRHA